MAEYIDSNKVWVFPTKHRKYTDNGGQTVTVDGNSKYNFEINEIAKFKYLLNTNNGSCIVDYVETNNTITSITFILGGYLFKMLTTGLTLSGDLYAGIKVVNRASDTGIFKDVFELSNINNSSTLDLDNVNGKFYGLAISTTESGLPSGCTSTLQLLDDSVLCSKSKLFINSNSISNNGTDKSINEEFTTQEIKAPGTSSLSVLSPIDMNSKKVSGLAAPTENGDASNKKYVDDEISKLVKGKASGTTEDHIVTWGSDGYSIEDSEKVFVNSIGADSGTNNNIPTETATRQFLPINAHSNGQVIDGDVLNVNLSNEFATNNAPRLVFWGMTNAPSDLSWGVRYIDYYSEDEDKLVARIVGYTTSGNSAVWLRAYNGNGWESSWNNIYNDKVDKSKWSNDMRGIIDNNGSVEARSYTTDDDQGYSYDSHILVEAGGIELSYKKKHNGTIIEEKTFDIFDELDNRHLYRHDICMGKQNDTNVFITFTLYTNDNTEINTISLIKNKIGLPNTITAGGHFYFGTTATLGPVTCIAREVLGGADLLVVHWCATNSSGTDALSQGLDSISFQIVDTRTQVF